jgi:hypothetical protein
MELQFSWWWGVVGFVVGFLDKGVDVRLGEHVAVAGEVDEADGASDTAKVDRLAAYPQQTADLGNPITVLGQQ